MRMFGVTKRRREQVGDGRDEQLIFGCQLPPRSRRDRTKLLATSEQSRRDNVVCDIGTVLTESIHYAGHRSSVARDRPRAMESVYSAQPERRMCSTELAGNCGQDAGHDRADGIGRRERSGDFRDRGERSRNRLGGTSPVWCCGGCLGHSVGSRKADGQDDRAGSFKTRAHARRNGTARPFRDYVLEPSRSIAARISESARRWLGFSSTCRQRITPSRSSRKYARAE
jgi:hypothetical protein